jgi:hypothetical protein
LKLKRDEIDKEYNTVFWKLSSTFSLVSSSSNSSLPLATSLYHSLFIPIHKKQREEYNENDIIILKITNLIFVIPFITITITTITNNNNNTNNSNINNTNNTNNTNNNNSNNNSTHNNFVPRKKLNYVSVYQDLNKEGKDMLSIRRLGTVLGSLAKVNENSSVPHKFCSRNTIIFGFLNVQKTEVYI